MATGLATLIPGILDTKLTNSISPRILPKVRVEFTFIRRAYLSPLPVTTENVALNSDALIASGDEATSLFNQMIDVSILCISAEAVGAMTSAYQKTVQYTKEREQFSQPISNFQVLQHRMVDMFVETEITKSLLIKATLQLDSKDAETSKTISALKVQVGKAGKYIGQQAVQLHGGMGVSNEMSIGHYLKRFTVIDSMFGNTQHHINKYSSL